MRNISVEQFSSLANVLIYLWTAFFVTCKFYVFRNNKKRRDTNLRMDHFVVCSGKIQDIDKHENLTKPITNCNLSIVSFQTRKIRNGLRFSDARWYPEMDLTQESKLGWFHQNQLVFVSLFLKHTIRKVKFCPKIQFWQTPNIFTSFSPKFFDNFSREIKVVNS